jgi:hypothetical protein
MGKRIPGTTAGCILPVLVVATVLSATASAADPNKPADPNVSIHNAKAPAQTMTIPALKPVPPVRRGSAALTRDTPLSEAIDILRHATTPPVNIVVLWRDLENAGIYRDTPIGFDGVPGLKVGQCLDLLTASLSAGASAKLGYVVRNGAVVVATTDGLPAPQKMARVYDISDLVAEPARYALPPFGFGGMGYGGYGGGMMGPGGGYGGGMMGPGGGYGGYGSPMMGPAGGYGGTYGGYSPGASYLPGYSYGANNMRNLSGFVGSTYGGTARRPGPYPGR